MQSAAGGGRPGPAAGAAVVGLLRDREVVSLEGLADRLGRDRSAAALQLQALVDAGVVERLRPVGCTSDRHDFYRLRRSPAVPCAAPRRRRRNRVAGLDFGLFFMARRI
jgi:hypothetical protein